MEVEFLEEALADALRESRFWSEKDASLKAEFVVELAKAIATLSQAPNAYVKVSDSRNLRRFHERRFHTHILYEFREETGKILIARIYNARMDPKTFNP